MTAPRCILPEPAVEEADVHAAVNSYGCGNKYFDAVGVALKAALRLHTCLHERELPREEIERHNKWFNKLVKLAQQRLKAMLAAGVIEVWRASYFRPGHGQQRTTYCFKD